MEVLHKFRDFPKFRDFYDGYTNPCTKNDQNAILHRLPRNGCRQMAPIGILAVFGAWVREAVVKIAEFWEIPELVQHLHIPRAKNRSI